ncbi:hypothetical protein [Pedobacter sp.]|uniref:hypothetical protein n=1 Tax=Pedobacter sp. TaxID=1411316 RepID=UPI003BA877F1
MRTLILFVLFATNVLETFARQNTFDIVTYNPPKNWSVKQNNSSIAYVRVDGKNWAQIGIYKHQNSKGDVKSDFDKDWEELVSTGRNISSAQKTEPKFEHGWFVMSGSGNWQYDGVNVASILTVYSNEKISVAILCNATALPYFKEYQTLINTLNITDGSNISASKKTSENADLDVKENENSIIVCGQITA